MRSLIFSKKKKEYAPLIDVIIGSKEKSPSKVKYQVIIVTPIILKKALLFFWYFSDNTSRKTNITIAANQA